MKNLLERVESKFSDALDLRGKIRAGEDELGLQALWLPSEDMVMDNPKKFNASFQKLLSLQDKIRELRTEYQKVRL